MTDSAPQIVKASAKQLVRDFWNDAPCGEAYAAGSSLAEQLAAQARTRYEMEPIIFTFAHFAEAKGKEVLEIGVGMGADHLEWAKAAPKRLIGVDLTPRAVDYTRRRLSVFGFQSKVFVADAEQLPFADESFDLVYAYGCLHHSPDTARAVSEVHRVLRKGGTGRIMIYHSVAPIGWLLWIRYALLRGRPQTSLKEIFAKYLESPGTKAFSRAEARTLFRQFQSVNLNVKMGPGDLLIGGVGQRHRGWALTLAKALWPRWILRRFDGVVGGGLLVEARK